MTKLLKKSRSSSISDQKILNESHYEIYIKYAVRYEVYSLDITAKRWHSEVCMQRYIHTWASVLSEEPDYEPSGAIMVATSCIMIKY